MTEKKYSSETTIPNDLLVCTNNVYEVLYKNQIILEAVVVVIVWCQFDSCSWQDVLQPCVIKFVSDKWPFGGCITNKTVLHNVTEILLIVSGVKYQ